MTTNNKKLDTEIERLFNLGVRAVISHTTGHITFDEMHLLLAEWDKEGKEFINSHINSLLQEIEEKVEKYKYINYDTKKVFLDDYERGHNNGLDHAIKALKTIKERWVGVEQKERK